MFHLINIHDLKTLANVLDANCSIENMRFSSIVVDSRKVIKNSVFLALKGEKYDGNDFCQEAIKNGAIAVISDSKIKHKNIINVEDSYIALLRLAQHQQLQVKVKTIAITGSNGKTSVKEILSHIFLDKNAVVTHRNENNEFGIPFTVLRLKKETQYLILECGARKLGDFDLISNYLDFDLVAITNINNSHIGIFGSITNIIKTKTKLFDALKEGGVIIDGCGFIDINDPSSNRYKDNSIFTIYQNDSKELWKLSSEPIEGPGNYSLNLCNEDNSYKIDNINLGAKHNGNNVLISFLIAIKIGLDSDRILQRLSIFQSELSNRFCIKRAGKHIFIDDTYNANPASMYSAINELKFNNLYPKNKIIILGDMLELGDDSSKEHLKLLKEVISLENLQYVLLKGNELKKATKNLEMDDQNNLFHELDNNNQSCVKEIIPILNKPSVILVKGSRGMKMEEIGDLLFSKLD